MLRALGETSFPVWFMYMYDTLKVWTHTCTLHLFRVGFTGISDGREEGKMFVVLKH